MDRHILSWISLAVSFILTTESVIFPCTCPIVQYPAKGFPGMDFTTQTSEKDEKQRRILVRRSINNLRNNEVAQNETTAVGNDERCNSDKLQRIMQENMFGDYREMKLRIMNYAEKSIGGLFSVVCAPGDFSYITTTRLYCLHTVDDINCLAFLTEHRDIDQSATR